MNVTITIPKRDAGVIVREYEEAEQEGMNLYFKVSNFPLKLKPGDKVYVIVHNMIIGYHKYLGPEEVFEDWNCEVTGREWSPGKYLVRDGRTWHWLSKKVPANSHRGFRYIGEDYE